MEKNDVEQQAMALIGLPPTHAPPTTQLVDLGASAGVRFGNLGGAASDRLD
jgi:hypothetical protein